MVFTPELFTREVLRATAPPRLHEKLKTRKAGRRKRQGLKRGRTKKQKTKKTGRNTPIPDNGALVARFYFSWVEIFGWAVKYRRRLFKKQALARPFLFIGCIVLPGCLLSLMRRVEQKSVPEFQNATESGQVMLHFLKDRSNKWRIENGEWRTKNWFEALDAHGLLKKFLVFPFDFFFNCPLVIFAHGEISYLHCVVF